MSIARRLSAAALTALMTLGLTACSGGEESSTAAKSGLEDGVLTVAMECAYAPYNWTQADDSKGRICIFLHLFRFLISIMIAGKRA